MADGCVVVSINLLLTGYQGIIYGGVKLSLNRHGQRYLDVRYSDVHFLSTIPLKEYKQLECC